MKAEALRELTSDELRDRVRELREQLLKLRFQKSTGQIESPQMLRGIRKDIARSMTILRSRQLGRDATSGGVETPGATATRAAAD